MRNRSTPVPFSLIRGVIALCVLSSCAVFTPSDTDYTANRSRSVEKQDRGEVSIHRQGQANRDGSASAPYRKTTSPKEEDRKARTPKPTPAEPKQGKSAAPSKTSPETPKVPAKSVKSKEKRIRRSLTPVEIEERDEVVKIARKLKGAKYKYGGKDPFGFDCSGYVGYVFEKDEVYLPATARAQSSIGRRLALDDVVEGDLLFFGEGKKVDHVALVTSNDGKHIYIIHSTTSAGVIEEDLYQSKYWMDRYLFARDVLGE